MRNSKAKQIRGRSAEMLERRRVSRQRDNENYKVKQYFTGKVNLDGTPDMAYYATTTLVNVHNSYKFSKRVAKGG